MVVLAEIYCLMIWRPEVQGKCTGRVGSFGDNEGRNCSRLLFELINGCIPSVFTWSALCVLLSFSYKDISPTGLGPP